MKISNIPTQPRILLYGYGLEGQSSEAWAKKVLEPTSVTVHEDRLGSAPDWNQFDLIIKSPGVPPCRIPDNVWPKVTSNLRLLCENLTASQRAKLIGITGSKGKSTTAKFTHQLLQTAGFKSTIIGNFGVPALSVWDDLDDLDYIVAECSSFQLYDLAVSPQYALFLSFFADHLEWHNDSEVDYLAAKSNLWRNQTAGDYLLVPSALPAEVTASLPTNNLHFAPPVPTDYFTEGSNLQAAHFRSNLGPVWALAEILKVPELPLVWQQTAAAYEPIEHRLELVQTVNDVRFYNDSIATSPDATLAGVNWLKADLAALILDGADTGVGPFTKVAKALLEHSPTCLVVLVDSPIATKFLAVPAAAKLNTVVVADYESALKAIQVTVSVGAVLFSPGGKSFNRFNNYAERGQNFKTLVKAL